MAQRRMISKKITDTDIFLDMPGTAQNLYFHLNMHADDEGFVDSPRKIMRIVGSREDDYRILIAKQFIFTFESGICVIRDWKIHNLIRSDRFTETLYTEEKKSLFLDENNRYIIDIEGVERNVIPDVIPKVTTGKDRLGKDNNIYSQEVKEIIDYLNSKANKNYKSNTNKTQSLIRARLKEGFLTSDFLRVIDNKVDDWLNDSKMNTYLRPDTLFGTKFEGYLNQPNNKSLKKSDNIYREL